MQHVSHGSASVLLVLIAFFGIRKARRVDWMLLLALIFYGIPTANPVLDRLHIRTTWFPFGSSCSCNC